MQAVQEITNTNQTIVGSIDVPEPRPVIQLDHIHKTYTMGDVQVHALRGASLTRQTARVQLPHQVLDRHLHVDLDTSLSADPSQGRTH